MCVCVNISFIYNICIWLYMYVCVCGKNLANVSMFFPQSFPSIHLLDDIGRDACTIPRLAHRDRRSASQHWNGARMVVSAKWCYPQNHPKFDRISVFQSWTSHDLGQPHVEKYLLNWSQKMLSLSLSHLSKMMDIVWMGNMLFPTMRCEALRLAYALQILGM